MNQPNLRFISAAITDRGLSQKRPLNEDSYLELSQHGLFAVADGVGGAQAGELASQTAMEVLYEAFAHPRNDVDTEELLEMAIQSANTAIYQMSHELPQLEMMATTIVALRLDGTVATIGHVGDSRIYRLDAKGNLFRETQDHSMVEEEVRAGRMTLAQAASHPSRNVISRALGAEETVEVDLKTIMFEPNSTFLLCSDGITRHVSDVEMRDILLKHRNPSEACRELKEICFARGAEDNLTAVIIAVLAAEAAEMATLANDFEDDDEATIPGIRPAATASAGVAETETKPFAANSVFAARGNTGKLSFAANVALPVPETTTSNAVVATNTAATVEPITPEPLSKPLETQPAMTYTPYNEDEFTEEKKGGFFSKLLGSLLLLLLGIGLGAGGFYLANEYLKQSQAKTATSPATLPKSGTVLFAESLESVDANPRATVEKYKNETATDAYLRGRAALSEGEAAKALEDLKKANTLLETAPNSEFNKETLRTEIMLAMRTAIAEVNDAPKTKDALETFNAWLKARVEKSKSTGWTNSGQTNAANSAANQPAH